MLFACLFAPDFAVQAALRFEPEVQLLTSPVAILDGPATLPRVVALNEAAREAGLELGMTMLQAAAVPGALLHKRVAAQEEAAQQALLDCAWNFSPCVELAGNDTALLDLSGGARLMGGPKAIGNELALRAAELGLEINVALAVNPDAAMVAARGFSGVTVIPAGKEAAALAPLPVEVLSPSPDILEVLDSWGIRTCKALASLPEVALVERLGQEGLRMQKLAQGKCRRTLVPAEERLRFEESEELEEALELLEPLSFILNRMLEQLMERLIARALATSEIHLLLGLEKHSDRQLSQCAAPEAASEYQRSLKIPVATQDPKLLLKLLQLELSAQPPEAAVKKITLRAEAARPRQAQAGLFMPAAPQPEKLEVLLARLRTAVGERDSDERLRVGAPRLLDSHQPDGFDVVHFAPPEPGERTTREERTPRAALRRFRPAIWTSVAANAGTPRILKLNGKQTSVIAASGPWRNSGAWWSRDRAWQREEWDLALNAKEGLGIYRVYRELNSENWFIEGIYD